MENDSKSVERGSCSSLGVEGCSIMLVSVGIRTSLFGVVGKGDESKESLFFQGGVLISSSSFSGALPTEIAVAPPAAFSP